MASDARLFFVRLADGVCLDLCFFAFALGIYLMVFTRIERSGVLCVSGLPIVRQCGGMIESRYFLSLEV